jgi:aspartate aminotransferase
MQASGIDVCNLSAGEPHFDTPAHIKAAAVKALEEGKTKYPPPAGISELREAIAHKLRQENGLNYQANNIIVTNGGKQGLFNLILALIEPGYDVIIPAPYWVSYPDMVQLAGGNPVIVPTHLDNGYKLTAVQLEENLTPRTKLLVLNSPCNPTGSVYSLEELHSLASVVVKHNLFVLSDEIYEKILYDGVQHHSIAAVSDAMLERTAISGGFTKSYAMTGWRLGYMAAPTDLIEDLVKIQGHSTSGICTFVQYGGIAALKGSQDSLQLMLQGYNDHRNYVLQRLQAMPKLSYTHPVGAFYVFINIRELGLPSLEFTTRLLTEHKVAVVPGAAFGEDDCIRISYSVNMDAITQGLDRLDKYIRCF